MRRILGAVVLLMGVLLVGWVLYNLFIQRLPETRGQNPVGALVVAGSFIYVGLFWLRGKSAP
jgi:hypothetical protein